MTVAAVAVDIDDDIAAKLLAKLQGEAGDLHHRDRVFAVHVEDRRVDHLRDLRTVRSRAGVRRQRGEADLVVHPNVDGAARAIARELGHVKYLGHNALPDKGGIAMDEDRHDLLAFARVIEDTLAARALPCTTGSTASRWLGLAASATRTSYPVGVVRTFSKPRWYFTSPLPPTDSGGSCPGTR